MLRTCVVRLRAAPDAGDVSLSGRGTDDPGPPGRDSSASLAAGVVFAQVVPWPVLVTQEWLAIVGWIKVGSWAIVLAGIVGLLIGAVVQWRKGRES